MNETTREEISPSVIMKRSQLLHELVGTERYKALAEHELFWRADSIDGLKESISDYREKTRLGKYKDATESLEESEEIMQIVNEGCLDTIYYLTDQLAGGDTYTNLDGHNSSLLKNLEGKSLMTSLSKGGNREIEMTEKKKLIVGVLSNLFVMKKMGEEVREDCVNSNDKRRSEIAERIMNGRVVVGEINGIKIADYNKRVRELWKDEVGSESDRQFLEECLYNKLKAEIKSSFSDIGDPRRDEKLFSLASQIFSEEFIKTITDEVFSEEGAVFVREIISEMINAFLIELRNAKNNNTSLDKAEKMFVVINNSLKDFEIVFEKNAPDLRVEGLRENFGSFSLWIDEVADRIDVSLTNKDHDKNQVSKLLTNYKW